MAKKKLSATQQLLYTPLSLPLVGILSLLATSLLSLNLYVFLNKPKESTIIPTTITQSALQDVLGTSISIGEKPKFNTALKNDPQAIYWQQIIAEKSNYRDAHITLAVMAFNARDCINTRFYLDKAYDIDPDNAFLRELTPKVQSCLESQK